VCTATKVCCACEAHTRHQNGLPDSAFSSLPKGWVPLKQATLCAGPPCTPWECGVTPATSPPQAKYSATLESCPKPALGGPLSPAAVKFLQEHRLHLTMLLCNSSSRKVLGLIPTEVFALATPQDTIDQCREMTLTVSPELRFSYISWLFSDTHQC
jgi:hypothetical protein